VLRAGKSITLLEEVEVEEGDRGLRRKKFYKDIIVQSEVFQCSILYVYRCRIWVGWKCHVFTR
jgi:hypothetical protein